MAGGGVKCLHNDTTMPYGINSDIAKFATRNFRNLCLRLGSIATHSMVNSTPLCEFSSLGYRVHADNTASVNLKHL